MHGGHGNIDHLAITATGVFVIDAKNIKGKVRVAKPLFGAAKLRITGRDRTKLIDGLDRQAFTGDWAHRGALVGQNDVTRLAAARANWRPSGLPRREVLVDVDLGEPPPGRPNAAGAPRRSLRLFS